MTHVTADDAPALMTAPIFRPTARCLVVDRLGRLLLFGGATNATRAWITPGGGVRLGESLPQAAARELAEETGLIRRPGDLGRVVAVCAGLWWAGSRVFFGVDSYYLVRADTVNLAAARHEDQERAALAIHRWWTADELDATADPVLPAEAAALLRTLLAGDTDGPPARLAWRVAAAPPLAAEP